MNKTKHAVNRRHIKSEPSADSQKDTSATGPDSDPVRRALIRATLKPNNGNPVTSRTAPVFTMHEQPRGGNGTNRSTKRFPNNNSQRDNDRTNRKTIKSKSSRQSQNNDRNGQSRSGRSAHLASSRHGKSRSRQGS
jgi:hypothetical protein